ncbi:calcium-activated chloride channel-domain-containing protein [Baffinella frigidus]|nr:calcium-activated chloride channel-domain-containing protein [Cryptophyta sp. CCMP2293]
MEITQALRHNRKIGEVSPLMAQRNGRGALQHRFITASLSDEEAQKAFEEGLSPAQTAAHLSALLLKVPRKDGVASLLSQAIRDGEVESMFPLHNEASIAEVWRSKEWGIMAVPVDEIRSYFGERVAWYFAFLSFYTRHALYPGVAGFLVWGWATYNGLSIDENPIAPFFGLGVAVWAHVCLKMWAREASALGLKWGVRHVEWDEEVRGEFYGDLITSPITGEPFLHYSSRKRLMHYFFSVAVTLPMLLAALATIFCLLNLQGYVTDPDSPIRVNFLADLAKPGAVFDQNGPLYFIPVLTYTCVVAVLNSSYSRVAQWLTGRENHRLPSEHRDALVIKRVIFEMFDAYAMLFYVTLYKLDVVALRQEVLSVYTCDEFRRVLLESALPYALMCVSRKVHGRGAVSEVDGVEEEKRREEEDVKGGGPPRGAGKEEREASSLQGWTAESLTREAGLEEEEDQFEDYLETTIQFGYVTMFAAACPLAGILSVVSNLVESRSDLFKTTRVQRRALPSRASNIPRAWIFVLNCVAFAAILTNCLIVGLSSEQLHMHFPSLFDAQSRLRSLSQECARKDYECLERAASNAAALPVAAGKGRTNPKP